MALKCFYMQLSGLNTDESSDNEPLVKFAKKASKAARKPFSVPPKKSVDTKKKGNFLSMYLQHQQTVAILCSR